MPAVLAQLKDLSLHQCLRCGLAGGTEAEQVQEHEAEQVKEPCTEGVQVEEA